MKFTYALNSVPNKVGENVFAILQFLFFLREGQVLAVSVLLFRCP